MVASVKAEIKQELHEEEIRQIFKDQLELQEFHATINEATDTANSIKDSLTALPEESLEKVKSPHEPE
jgi:signal recognition particle receptor subunit beta